MTTNKLLEQGKEARIGKKPVVVVPLEVWEELEERLENAEMYQSKSFRASIATARKEKKFYSLAEVKRRLKL